MKQHNYRFRPSPTPFRSIYFSFLWGFVAIFLFMGTITPHAQESQEPEPEQESAPEETIPPIDLSPVYIRALGNHNIGLSLGLFIPLFFIDPHEPDIDATNLTVGGVGTFLWDIYLNSWLSIGLRLQGMFALSPNERPLFLVPIMARVGIHPAIGIFEFPLYLEMGMNISLFQESTKFDFITKLTAGFYWNINVSWAVGIDVEYWFIPQLYLGTLPPSEDRIGNFMTVMAGVKYYIP